MASAMSFWGAKQVDFFHEAVRFQKLNDYDGGAAKFPVRRLTSNITIRTMRHLTGALHGNHLTDLRETQQNRHWAFQRLRMVYRRGVPSSAFPLVVKIWKWCARYGPSKVHTIFFSGVTSSSLTPFFAWYAVMTVLPLARR